MQERMSAYESLFFVLMSISTHEQKIQSEEKATDTGPNEVDLQKMSSSGAASTLSLKNSILNSKH